MKWRVVRVVGLIGVVTVALIAVLLTGNPLGHKVFIKAYFTNAMSLRPGAPVRMAGVDIGSVKTVRARPELKEAPAEVVMVLTTSYELRIPNDSIASLSTAGILGETYVAIDASHASGTPIEPNAVLKTIPTTELTTHEMLEKFSDILSKKCDCDSERKDDASDAIGHKKLSKNLPQH
jgi:phospholipid/cholesterol/gamma-HCH transport system substrate-binding protein